MRTISQVRITPDSIVHNGESIPLGSYGLGNMYRELIGSYPKFFKMDSLCKLGFIGAELLLRDIPSDVKENAAVILFNRSGSLITDRNYENTIFDEHNYFPSPALFVYTLANIVTGEITIRHKIYGETSFYILDKEDWYKIDEIVSTCYLTSNPSIILTGWVEYVDENDFIADMKLIVKENN